MRNKKCQERAKKAAEYIKEKAGPFIFCYGDYTFPSLKAAIILGTGWDKVLMSRVIDPIEISFSEIPGFEYLKQMGEIEGHSKKLIVAKIDRYSASKIVMLRGRVHLNEDFDFGEVSKMVRLQMEMLMELGIKNFVLTNAAGGLRPRGLRRLFKKNVRIGDIIAHNSFITAFAPKRPLVAGEFVCAEDMLKEKNIEKIERCAKIAKLRCFRGAGAMVIGPDFESIKYDKGILAQSGAVMAMMSILPEVAVLALNSEINVFAMSCICNDDIAKHSHKGNLITMEDFAPRLGSLLINLINTF